MSDSNEQETKQEDVVEETVSQPAVELPGRRLRETRESNHLSLDEVAHHLRLDVQLITALEKDDYSDLSPAYICGYLRSYARLLKLPEDEVVQAYSHGEQISAVLIPSSVSIKPRKALKLLVLVKPILIIVIILLVAGGLYFLSEKFQLFSPSPEKQRSDIVVPVAPATVEDKTDSTTDASANAAAESVPSKKNDSVAQQGDKPVQAVAGKTVVENLPTPKTTIPENESIAVSTQQAATKPATNAAPTSNEEKNTTAATAANTKQLKLHFNADSWAEITDSTGKKLVYRLVRENTDLTLDGVPPFTILLGNAPAVQVFYDGKEFDHSRYHRDQVAYFKLGKQ